ncbi:MAG: hypothetical protein JSS20_02310 [Proteobacteria bacterium]|nr:hypothetical protein [Pseudomonadota bacterium]
MTRTLLIAYDLARPEQTRPQLADAVMSLGEAWARPLETVWLVRTRLAPEAVEAKLSELLDSDDGLMVQEARGEAQFVNTGARWFRPKRQAASAALETAAVLAFPQDGERFERAA